MAQNCASEFKALSDCGGALPGFEECQNVGIVYVNGSCLRSAVCGMSLDGSNCEAAGREVEWPCSIDGIRAFVTRMPASACSGALGPTCGPVLF